MKDATETLNETSARPEPFKPYVRYDSKRDCIQALVKDCPVVEVPILNTRLTVLKEKTGTEKINLIGYRIERVREVCRIHRLHTENGLEIRHIAEALGKEFKRSFQGRGALKIVVLRLIETHNLHKVEIPKA